MTALHQSHCLHRDSRQFDLRTHRTDKCPRRHGGAYRRVESICFPRGSEEACGTGDRKDRKGRHDTLHLLVPSDPAGSSEAERRQHRRRQKTQQVRFKDLAEGPDEAGGRKTPETSAQGPEVDRQTEPIANSQRNWQQARPCSLTLPNPRKACTSTAIQTSPSLQKQFGAFRFRSKSVGDFGEPGERQDGLALPSAPLPGVGGETRVADAREEVEEEEEQGEPEGVDRATAINGRGAERAGAPLSNCADPDPALSSQQ
eukprot:g36235.t1